jgi:hypothetical protein
MHMLSRRVRREEGLAMVTALLVTFVIFMLSVVVVKQAIHNVDASGYGQRRLVSVSAAEAGLNWAYNQLEFTDVFDLWTGTDGTPLTMDVGSGDVDVDVVVTYYADDDGLVPYDMSTPSVAAPPQSLKITSTGVAAAGVERTMESFALLTPVYGGLDGAVITNSALSLTNNFNLSGNDGNDGDIIVESGNFSAPSGVEVIRGSIYVPNGTALIRTNTHIYGSVWANGSVTVNHPTAQIDGDVKSSASSISMTSGHASGSAYYCTAITNPNKVDGTKVQTCTDPPDTFGFPLIQFHQSLWQEQGFYIQDFRSTATACSAARSWITGTGSGTYNGGTPVTGGIPDASYSGVAVITPSSCRFRMAAPPNTENVTVGSDLAIIAYGGIELENNSAWTGTGATRRLFVMSPYDGTSANCDTQDVSIGTRNSFINVEVSVYTVCTASVENNNTFPGQIIGANTEIQGNFTMSYRPVLIPGSDVTGFEQDIAYIREVAN